MLSLDASTYDGNYGWTQLIIHWCPINKTTCDGCSYLGTAGCTYDQSQSWTWWPQQVLWITCPHCSKCVDGNSGFAYCPHCGQKLYDAKGEIKEKLEKIESLLEEIKELM